MSRIRRQAPLFALVALLGLLSLAFLPTTPGPMLFVGGPIVTMVKTAPVVEALAVDGDRIAGVGSREELAEWIASHNPRVIDLAGHAMLPGFVDAHSHFPASGILDPLVHLGSPPLGNITNVDGIVSALSEHARDSRRGEWIVGWGYDDSALADARHPTRADLDRVSTSEPVVAFHVSMHVAAVNSKALEVLGLGDASPDPVGGRLRRAKGGALDGVLEEEAIRPLLRATLVPGIVEGILAARRAAATYLAAGVTTAQDGAAQSEQIRGLVWMSRLRLLPIRLVIWPEGDAALELLDSPTRILSNEWLRIGASKFVADGSIQAYTAYLSKPYFTPPAGGAADERGRPRIAREQLFELVRRVHEAGGQLAIHGNGDAEIDDILDAIEAAQLAHPRGDPRHILVHAQMVREDQLDRMKDLGVVPSFFELHTYYWGDRHRDRFLGPERAARISPLHSAQERKLGFSLHCDTPVVPMEPLRMVAAAVTRKTASGSVLGEDQKIDVMTALRAVTIFPAWQNFINNLVGSFEEGKMADMVIVDRSPLDVAPEDLDKLRVLETYLGGKSVYRADSQR